MSEQGTKTTVRLTKTNVKFIEHRKREFGTPKNTTIQRALDSVASADETFKKKSK